MNTIVNEELISFKELEKKIYSYEQHLWSGHRCRWCPEHDATPWNGLMEKNYMQ